MKVLVTGAKGQVGQEVVLAFRTKGHEVCAYGSQDLDITQEQCLEKIFNEQQGVDFIINCAAYTAVDQAETNNEQAYLVNAVGVKNLALCASRKKIPLMHLSTDYVFDGTKTSAYGEEDRVNSQSVYGKTKWEGEKFVRELASQHLILRVSWVFGRFGHNFVKTMLKLFAGRSELEIVNDQYGCPTAAQNIAKVILSMCEYNLNKKPHWGTYHYCDQPETTWFEFACKVYEIAQPSKVVGIKAIPTEAYPTPAKRPKHSVLSTKKIQVDFNIRPFSWEAGLRFVLEELGK